MNHIEMVDEDISLYRYSVLLMIVDVVLCPFADVLGPTLRLATFPQEASFFLCRVTRTQIRQTQNAPVADGKNSATVTPYVSYKRQLLWAERGS